MIFEPYYDLLPKMPFKDDKKYYVNIVKKMKHKKHRKKKGK